MKIVVLAGGVSTERDVSLCSGRGVYNALKERGHQVVLLDVFMGYQGDISSIFDQDRNWAESVAPVSAIAPDIDEVRKKRAKISSKNPNELFGDNVIEICQAADIVFMALHGDCGENGKIQAAFDLFGIKYTGTDHMSSAMAMDKAVTKQIFLNAGVNTPKGVVITSKTSDYTPDYPCVVKVCNGGSSVGVYIAKNKDEYDSALKEAFTLEGKVLVEEFIKGRELTDGVIEGVALPVVEIAPKEGFYDYKNKYQAGSAIETCPALIPDEITKKVQEEAVKAFNALGIKTYARMDFIYREDGEVFCLEANTLPGMTPTSLIPQEAAVVGKNYGELCEWIIEVSLKKYN